MLPVAFPLLNLCYLMLIYALGAPASIVSPAPLLIDVRLVLGGVRWLPVLSRGVQLLPVAFPLPNLCYFMLIYASGPLVSIVSPVPLLIDVRLVVGAVR